MAFTEAQQKELAVASQNALDKADEIANMDEVEKIISGISQATKIKVYLIGDSLIGLSALMPQVAIIILSPDPYVKLAAVGSSFATAGLFILTMFGIYKSGKK